MIVVKTANNEASSSAHCGVYFVMNQKLAKLINGFPLQNLVGTDRKSVV